MSDHTTDAERLQPMTFDDIPRIVAALDTLKDFWTGEGWTYDHGIRRWYKGEQYMTNHVAILEYQRVQSGESLPF